jgi:hypothetical protein
MMSGTAYTGDVERALAAILLAACSADTRIPADAAAAADAAADAAGAVDAAATDAAAADGFADFAVVAAVDLGGAHTPLQDNRDRLLQTYLAYLKSTGTTQSNGLNGANLVGVCALWMQLDPSSRDVFLTLTARMQGSRLGDDGSFMLDHVVKVYRINGGQGASAGNPGSCGGGEYNRMIMSMDAHLQASLVAANTHKGARQPNGNYDVADIPATSFWRDSHDLGGPHAPFDLSDETNAGAPRGQVQYFHDPASALANSALGRMDLTTLVDPLALEMDQDYDCVHNSNPDCNYITYGPACLPQTQLEGVAIYVMSYGSIEAGFDPCK